MSDSSGTRVTGAMWVLELSLSPLEDQQVLLITEPLLCPPLCLESGSLTDSARLTGLQTPGILSICLPPYLLALQVVVGLGMWLLGNLT